MTPLLSNQLLRTQSDGRLTALAAAGHDRAFEAIVDRYRQPLSRYLRRLLSEALAEDVLQATFVRAWQALATGSEVRDLRPWLYRIAHNQALNALRAATASLPHATDLVDASGAVPTMSTEGEVERREELRHTLSGIGALPDRQRAALVAVAVADRPHSDVAAELGLTDGALRQLLLRARTALRAAATAITPYPLVGWLSAGQEASAARVAEVAAGAGGAGLGLKAGAVLAAGAVVAGAPALRDEHAPARATRSSSTTTQTKPTAAATLIGDHRGGAQAKAADDRGTGSGSGVSVVHRASASSGHSGSQTPHRSSSGSSGSGSGESGSGTDDSSSEAHRSGSSSDDSGAEFKGSNSRDESSDDHAVSSGDNELSQRSGSEDHPDESPSTGQGSEETAGTPTTPSPPPAAGEGDGSGHVEDTSPSGSGGD